MKGLDSERPLTFGNDDIPGLLREILNTLHHSEHFPRLPQDDHSHFWQVYHRVANEHDEEFLARSNTNLDSLLIFAGLFSAVSSTFLADMRTSLLPDPSDTTNLLLQRLIDLQINNNSFLGDSTKPLAPTALSPFNTAIQCLGWASLASSLLAAFGAVLSKQWLAHYKATRFGHGTIEERCRRRQEKFMALESWHMEAIIDALPRLLQLSLLLFGVSLSANLLQLNWAIGGVLSVAILFGIAGYVATFVAAIATPESPFKSGSTKQFLNVLQYVPFRPSRLAFQNNLLIFVRKVKLIQGFVVSGLLYIYRGRMRSNEPTKEDASEAHWSIPNVNLTVEDNISPNYFTPSNTRDVHAVNWIIQSSTDPQILLSAIKLIPTIEWPTGYDCDTLITRIVSIFDSCFNPQDSDEPMPESLKLVISCLQAGAHLYIIQQSINHQDIPSWMMPRSAQIRSVFKSPECPGDVAMIWWMMRWPGLYLEDKTQVQSLLNADSINDIWISYLLPYVVKDRSLTISVSTCLELIAWCMQRRSKAVVTNSYIAASIMLEMNPPISNDNFIKIDKSPRLHDVAERFLQNLPQKFGPNEYLDNEEQWLYLLRLLGPLAHSLDLSVHEDHMSMVRDVLSRWGITLGLRLLRSPSFLHDRSNVVSALRLGIQTCINFTNGSGKPVEIFSDSADVSLLIAHYLAVQNSNEDILAEYDALVVLGSMDWPIDPSLQIPYLKGLISSMNAASPSFLRYAAVRATSSISQVLFELSDSSLCEALSSALADTIVSRSHKATADETLPVRNDNLFFKAFNWLGVESSLPCSYIKLVEALSCHPNWTSLIWKDGHFKMSLEIGESLLTITEESLYGNSMDCLQFCCQYILEMFGNIALVENFDEEISWFTWRLLAKSWHVLPAHHNMYDAQDTQRKVILDFITNTTISMVKSDNNMLEKMPGDLLLVITQKVDQIWKAVPYSRMGRKVEDQIFELQFLLN